MICFHCTPTKKYLFIIYATEMRLGPLTNFFSLPWVKKQREAFSFYYLPWLAWWISIDHQRKFFYYQNNACKRRQSPFSQILRTPSKSRGKGFSVLSTTPFSTPLLIFFRGHLGRVGRGHPFLLWWGYQVAFLQFVPKVKSITHVPHSTPNLVSYCLGKSW